MSARKDCVVVYVTTVELFILKICPGSFAFALTVKQHDGLPQRRRIEMIWFYIGSMVTGGLMGAFSPYKISERGFWSVTVPLVFINGMVWTVVARIILT